MSSKMRTQRFKAAGRFDLGRFNLEASRLDEKTPPFDKSAWFSFGDACSQLRLGVDGTSRGNRRVEAQMNFRGRVVRRSISIDSLSLIFCRVDVTLRNIRVPPDPVPGCTPPRCAFDPQRRVVICPSFHVSCESPCLLSPARDALTSHSWHVVIIEWFTKRPVPAFR